MAAKSVDFARASYGGRRAAARIPGNNQGPNPRIDRPPASFPHRPIVENDRSRRHGPPSPSFGMTLVRAAAA